MLPPDRYARCWPPRDRTHAAARPSGRPWVLCCTDREPSYAHPAALAIPRPLPVHRVAVTSPLVPGPVPLHDLLGVPGADARLAGAPREGVRILDVTHDSRDAGPGVLFACRPGSRADGHDFAPAAVAAGSPALLVERVLDLDVPQLLVPSVAQTLGPVAARVHADPSSRLMLLGVTGTNGKTTTSYLLESVLRAAGHVTGLIGTVQTVIAGEAIDGIRTTPEASDLQRLLRRMVDAKVTAAAMEVSSHGLALSRVTGTRFAAAAFTNLSRDHLDFHPDLEAYHAAKANLFTPTYTDLAVVNVDDPAGRRIAKEAAARGLRVTKVSVRGHVEADVSARDITLGPARSAFTALLHGRPLAVTLRLPGSFNIDNALLALATADAAGTDPQTAVAGIGELTGVPGRMERVDAGQPFTVLVDYAHTPDSVASVLRAARPLTSGRIIIVIGCGGERDRGKRRLMGRQAAALADLAIFTNDNPRGEDPRSILEAIASGARWVASARWTVEEDRRDAIALAIDQAEPGDVVVIAGKGHESYQEIAGRRLPFDDRAVARSLLAVTNPAAGINGTRSQR